MRRIAIFAAFTIVLSVVLAAFAGEATGAPVWPSPESWQKVQTKWVRFRYDGQTLRGWAVEYWNGLMQPRFARYVLIFFYDDPAQPDLPGRPTFALQWYGVFDANGLRRYQRVEAFMPSGGQWVYLTSYLVSLPRPLVENKLLFFDPASQVGQIFRDWAVAHGARADVVGSLVPYWETKQNEKGEWKLYFWYPQGVDVPAPLTIPTP
jgi:hypothetical protein